MAIQYSPSGIIYRQWIIHYIRATNPMNLKDVITAIIGEMRKMISEGITRMSLQGRKNN